MRATDEFIVTGKFVNTFGHNMQKWAYTPMSKNPVPFDDEPLAAPDQGPSFADILSEYEQGRRQPREAGAEGRDGLVVAVSPEGVFVDIGFKMEGVIDPAAFGAENEAARHGILQVIEEEAVACG